MIQRYDHKADLAVIVPKLVSPPSEMGDDQRPVRRSQRRHPSLPPEDGTIFSEKQNGNALMEEKQNSDRGKGTTSFTSAALETSLPYWIQTASMILLIFGGCCSNVGPAPNFSGEEYVNAENTPDAGLVITLTQFVLVASHGWYMHFSTKHPPFFVLPNQVPLRRWLLNIILFFSINVLNNFAFAFRISVPVHIILRSGGSVTTMAVGYLYGKRFSRVKVISVGLLTVGVVIAAMADANAQGKSTTFKTESSLSTFFTGLAILFFAQLLSALMGIYVQETYAKYGTHWEENVFYTHILSLPLFLPMLPRLRSQFHALAASDQFQFPLYLPSFSPERSDLTKSVISSPYLQVRPDPTNPSLLTISIPSALLYLVLNALTQFACIRGVNKLAARSSAVAVTIVLNIRKLASLLLSVWLFGNNLAPGVLVGALVVFAAGGLYASDSSGGGKAKAKGTETKKGD
ncbi:MAG: golgi uridine diphosphate-N- acetylglucosamine transporter [Sclerophora amabilis]|nr:MAG: golgi uridine diphosphate-N- acetylglucosamine transporter [Sclerophora amabilis]